MSGIEVAGLAVGVVPILVEVVKSYSTVREKVRTFRHCTQEVKEISADFCVIQITFKNEVRWLLRAIQNEQQAKSILDDGEDWRLVSGELSTQLHAVLKDSYGTCCDIMERTKLILEEMEDELEKFDVLLIEKSQTESIRSTYKRLRRALKITVNRSKYDRCLGSLRDRNSELCNLRSQIIALQQQEKSPSGICIQHNPLPTQFKAIQNASRQLHSALCGAWRCDDAAHRGHHAKLCLDADVVDEVVLDLAISCHAPVGGNTVPPQEQPIWLYVQSTSMSERTPSDGPKPQEQLDACASLINEMLESCTSNTARSVKKKASTDLSEDSTCKKKAKRVRFAGPKVVQTVPPSLAPVVALGINLCTTKNICNYLRRTYDAQLTRPAKHCLGYLESPQMYKHMFYFRDKALKPQSGISSIRDALRQDVYDTLQPEDRLKLAHKLALATLQYNDTPWLHEQWRLQDLNYLGSSSSFSAAALQTLHFNSRISTPPSATLPEGPMDGIQRATHTVTDQVRFGITNTTLFFLGIALLEIAYWKPIEEKMTAGDEDNQIFAARRLMLDRGAPLGPEYQRIAQKCLECNFGFGNKLGNRGLQSAVYNDVVCQLERMVGRLEIC